MFKLVLILTTLLLNLNEQIYSISVNDTTCRCSVSALEGLEQLNFFNYRRLRIEHSDGLRKFSSSEITSKTLVECRSTALYEKVSDSKLGKLDKRCRTCIFNETSSFWSDLETCGIIKCDKDLLIGNPKLDG